MSGIIGGIEGGATHSHVILVDQKGQILAALEGPGTNHHLIGIEECQRLINEMVDEAKAKANLPLEEPLLALGLSLSGCEREESNQEIIKGLEQNYPNLSKQYAIGSDTDGSVAATSDKGGVVCISGTGSNTLLINPDGSRAQCGGWGYLLGDEGSAWKMVYMAIKMCFEDLDKYEPAPHPINNVWKSAMQFFGCSSQADFLDKFYRDFNKAKLASFCRILANLADDGDKLSQYIFFQAGQQIARSLSAVILKASPKLLNREGGLQVSCVGSVWLSWHLLKRGFVAWIDKHSEVKELSLIKVVSASGLGAAYMACDTLNIQILRNYEKNYHAFYQYKRNS